MIYFDNGSTTPVNERVKTKVVEYLNNNFGNPSSLHKLGVEAEKRIKSEREKVARYLGVESKNIVFTSGGTESNNNAIKGACYTFQNRGKHIITTIFEHASVYNTFKDLQAEGFEVEYLKVDSNGFINIDELKKKIRKDTILVSIMHVNNEIGSVQNLESIGKAIKEVNNRTVFHTDAVASFGKIPMEIKKWGVDLLTASGHKVYTPSGIGFLYVRDGLKLNPLISGGGHEDGRRSGTENVLGIVALGESISILSEKNIVEEMKKANELRTYLVEKIKSSIKDVRLNSPEVYDGDNLTSSPFLVNLGFKGVKAEVLLHYLESKDVYVSTTSACNSKSSKKASRVLDAIKVPQEYLEGSLRITFSHNNTKEEVDEFVSVLEEGLLMLRMLRR